MKTTSKTLSPLPRNGESCVTLDGGAMNTSNKNKSPLTGRFRGVFRGVFLFLLFTLLSTLTAGAYTGVRLTQNTGYLFLNDSEIEITGTGGPNTRLYIAHEGTVTLRDVNITNIDAANHWPAIYCSRDVTIILEGKNKVYSGHASYPAIEIVAGKTLTIIGDGSLDARSPYGSPGGGAAIGGEVQSKCGNIIIEGGTIDARSGTEGAGIGGGGGSIDNNKSHCGYIAIGMGVKSVTASGGFNAIGAGYSGSCGTVTIGGNVVGSTGSYYSYTPPTDYHTLHFDANGGTGGTPNQYAVDAASTISIASCLFTRENSRFTGWNTAADGSGTAYAEGESITLTSDITLYAQWGHKSVTYKIFNEDNVSLFLEEGDVLTGGGPNDSKATIADGATVTFRDVKLASAPDQIFPRITCQGDATIILSGTNKINGGLHSAGIYVPEGHTLTIRGNGSLTAMGSYDSAGIGGGGNQSCGNIIITNEVAFVTAKAGTGIISIGQGEGNNLSCGTVTIGGIETGPIAQNPFTYNPSTIYTVSFDANGGSGTMAGQSFRWGTPQSLNACTFTAPEDDSFFGWNTAADGSGTAYDDGQSININHDMTLYAQWAIPVWVGNSQVTSVNRHDILGDGTTSFDPVTNTLTLDHPTQDVTICSEGIDLTVKGVYQMSDAAGDVALDVVGGSLTLDGDFTLRGAVNGVQAGGDMNVKGQLRAYGTSGSGIHYTGTDNAWLTLQQGFFGDTRVEMQGGTKALSYTEGNAFRIAPDGFNLVEPVGGEVMSSNLYCYIRDAQNNDATRAVVTLAGTANGEGTEASPFQINSSDDWTMACADVANGCETEGLYFEIGANITASAMMGRPDNPFAGVIDGQRNFFKVTTDINNDVEGAALFRAVSGATIKNFLVEGTINGGAASGGIVGQAVGGTTTMENSVFNGTVSTAAGEPAGNLVVGNVASGATVTYNNCLDATHLLWPATDSRAYSVTGVDATLTLTGSTGIAWNNAIYAPADATVEFTMSTLSSGAYVATGGTLTKSDDTYSLVMPAQNVAIVPNDAVPYAIAANSTTGGSVDINKAAAPAGTPVYVTATPDAYYLLGTITVKDEDDNELPMTMYEDGFGFFTMPSSPVTVTVTFNKKYSFENGELRLLLGEFNALSGGRFGTDVTGNPNAVLKVTAAEGVRFTQTCAGLFQNFTNCTEIDLSNVNTSAMTHTTSMFAGCTNLQELNLTGWDMQNVEYMEGMFENCSSLRELDLSDFNITADMRELFAGAGMYKLTLPAGMGVAASMRLGRGYYSSEYYGEYNNSGWQLLGDKTVVSGSEQYDGWTCATLLAQPTVTTYVWKKMPDDFFLELSDGEDNSAVVEAWDGVTTNVQLTGRKLWKDGDWNTICLPFDFTNYTDYDNIFYSADELLLLDTQTKYNADGDDFYGGDDQNESDFTLQTGFDETTGTLRLYFDIMPSFTSNTPYIIRWDEDPEHPYIESPEFKNVVINNSMNPVTSNDGTVTFTGTYDNRTFTVADRSVLFLGAENSLYYPDGTSPTTIKPFRAYFQLNGITAGDPTDPSSPVKAFVLNFGDKTTGIRSMDNGKWKMDNGQRTMDNEDDAWYDLSGRKVSLTPNPSPVGEGGSRKLPRGIYIHNGRKVVIK